MAFKGVGQSPFCVENDFSSFFLIQGGNQSLKEGAGSEEMNLHADEAQGERMSHKGHNERTKGLAHRRKTGRA